MTFFSSFAALGYSAINLLLVWLVIVVVLWRVLKLAHRHWSFKVVFGAIMLGILVFTTEFLADQNRMLNDAIREDGGLKRTQER